MKRWLIGILLVILTIVAIAVIAKMQFLHKNDNQTTYKQDNVVKVARVTVSDAGTVFPLVGMVKANRSIIITPEVTARVAKVHVKSTQAVNKGDILIELDSAREKALLAQERITLKDLNRKLSVSRTLKKKGVVSLDALEQLEAETNAQEALVKAKEYEVAIRTIKAPFAGVLSLHSINQGLYVKPDDKLLQLDDLSRVYVDFLIPERFLSQLVIGQEVTATTDAWPGHRYIGRITEIDTHVDTKTLALRVRVYFKNDNLELLDGMMLEMHLTLAQESLPNIPLKAISYLGDERFVYVLRSNNTVARRKIVLGPVNGANVAIREGIRENQLVVVEGVEKLRDGSTVKVIRQDNDFDLIETTPLKKKEQVKGDRVL